MPYDARAEGGGNSSRPAPQKVARQTTIKARPAPSYSAPPSYNPPVTTTSSGQYRSGGGGAPQSAPSNYSQGAIGGVGRPAGGGNNGPSQQQIARQQRIQQRVEARKERQAERKKTKEFRNFLAGDETYQSSISTLQKELEDYILGNTRDREKVREDFSLAQSRMGDERTNALEDMKNDFAARGLLNSSEFADAIGDYDTQYNQRLGDLTRDQERNVQSLLESLGLYRTTNRNERINARQEAIRRRTEQFNGWTPGG